MNEDDIYSSVPDEVKSSGGDRFALSNFLEENKGKFFKSTDLSVKFGFKKGSTQVALRQAITEMIEIESKPIVANPKGFGWASHPNQLKFYAEQPEQRKAGLQRRINKIIKIYNGMEHD